MSWLGRSVIEDVAYRLHLCQVQNGLRLLRLVEAGSAPDRQRSEDVILATQIVPHHLLRAVQIEAIAKTVPLENGEIFYVTAHRTWLAASEYRQFADTNHRGEFVWITSQPPLLN